jgi:hypothetical protein
MSVSKVKVALAFSLAVGAFGVGVGVSQHARPGGGHTGACRVTTPGAREATGREPLGGAAPAFGRYYAGGFRSLRGFAFRGEPAKASSTEGFEEADAQRGGCQEFRIEAVPGTQLQRYTVRRRQLSLFDRAPSLGVNSDAGLAGSIVLNERNFDIPRGPLNSPECRSPSKADGPLYLVDFRDAGTVERGVSPHDDRVPAGAGLRITVPMLGPVPVPVDFGFPVVKPPEAPGQTFSFWIGFFS